MMGAESQRQTVCDNPSPGVRVARFIRPDVREQLYDREAIDECALFRELHAATLGDLPAGGTVILNFGLTDYFPTAFYRLLLRFKQEVTARGVRLLLCCLTPNVREGFALMGGDKTFQGQLRETESRALYDARHPAG
jgi:anti-anti-sigma regulatory factor